MSLLLPLFASYSTGVSLTHNLPSILLQHSFCFFNPLEHSPPRKSHLDEICSLNFFSSDLPTFHLLLGGLPSLPNIYLKPYGSLQHAPQTPSHGFSRHCYRLCYRKEFSTLSHFSLKCRGLSSLTSPVLWSHAPRRVFSSVFIFPQLWPVSLPCHTVVHVQSSSTRGLPSFFSLA